MVVTLARAPYCGGREDGTTAAALQYIGGRGYGGGEEVIVSGCETVAAGGLSKAVGGKLLYGDGRKVTVWWWEESYCMW